MPFLLRIQKKYKEIAYKWYWQAGRLFKQMGNEAQAIVSYKNQFQSFQAFVKNYSMVSDSKWIFLILMSNLSI
jgi:hypothetical protein